MADKTVEIEVVTNTDISSVEDLQTALEDTESSAENLNETVESADGSNVEDVTSDVEELGESAEDAASGIDEIQSSMDMLEASALMSIGNELSNIGGQAEDMAQGMNTAAITVGQLATNTGIAEPQMISLVNTITNSTFPQAEAMAYIGALQQMGVSADKLGDSATNMDRINDATGMGYTNVMQLTQGLRSVGVEADNLPSAFNAIAYAQANVNGGAQTLSQVFKRQASTINEYGLTVDQTVLIMQKLSEQGVQGMKMGSALSSVLKENNGDLSAIEQSLGMQPGALANASSATGQYEGQLQTLADEEREHKTLLDELNTAWEKLSLSMSPVLAPLSSFMGIIGQAGSFAVQINGLIKLGNSIRGLSIVQSIGGKLSGLRSGIAGVGSAAKTAMLNVGSFAKTLATSVYQAAVNGAKALASLAKEVLIAGYNALKSAAMWVVQKAQVVASTIADYAATAAQWALNAAMNANPIMLVVLAIVALIAVLGYLYFNNETVRNAINGLGQTFMWVGQIIYTSIVNAVNWVIGALQNLWNYVITLGGMLPANVSITGNNIVDTILRVMAFIATLPIQLGIIFVNAIAKVLGFGDNFVQNMVKAATKSVTNFANSIATLPGKLATELNNMLSAVGEWAATLPQKFWEAGVNAVKNFLAALGIASPGIMQRTLVWEISEMARRTPIEARPLLENVGKMGSDIVDEFGKPTLSVGYDDIVDEFRSLIDFDYTSAIQKLNSSVLSIDYSNMIKELSRLKLDVNYQGIVEEIGRQDVVFDYSSMVDELNNLAISLNYELPELTSSISIDYNNLINELRSIPFSLNYTNPEELNNSELRVLYDTRLAELDTSKVSLDYANLIQELRDSQLNVDYSNLMSELGKTKIGLEDTANERVINISNDNEEPVQQVNNFYFTDTVIDNDDRMEAICDYITRRIAFNNTTAGRTV